LSFRVYALDELVDVKGGGTPSKKISSYWKGNIPWATVKDLKSREINQTEDYISSEGVVHSATNIIPSGTIIVPTRMALGKVAIAGLDLAINQDLKALIIKSPQRVDKNYLARFLESQAHNIVKKGKGATVKGITLDVLKTLEVPLPPLPVQKQIAAVLEKADNLRQQSKKMEQELGDLEESIFIEVHSNAAKQNHQFKDIVLKTKHSFVNGPFGSDLLSSELTTSGVPVIYIRDIAKGEFIRKKEVFVTNDKALSLSACSVTSTDVLVAKVGDPPGTAAIYPPSMPDGIVTQDVIRMKCDKNVVLPEYLVAYLNSDIGRHSLKIITVQATRSRIGLGDFKKLEICLPDIDRQIMIVSKLQKIRELVLQSRKRTDEFCRNFKSLMQRAFKGELDLKDVA